MCGFPKQYVLSWALCPHLILRFNLPGVKPCTLPPLKLCLQYYLSNLPAKSVLFGLCTDDRKESFLALRSRVPLCFFFIFQGKFSRFSRRSACSIREGFVAIYRDLVSPGYFVIFQFFFHCYGQLCWWWLGGGRYSCFFLILLSVQPNFYQKQPQ